MNSLEKIAEWCDDCELSLNQSEKLGNLLNELTADKDAEIKRLREALGGIKSGAEFYERSSGNKSTAIYGLGLVVERCNLALKDPCSDKGTEAN